MSIFVRSATERQWFQWTYAVVMNGYQDARGTGVFSTSDGSLWLFSANPHRPSRPQESEWWIGKVSPEGCVRVFGNSWTVDPSLTLDGALEEGKAPFRFVRGGSFTGVVVVPVGDTLWVWSEYANNRWFIFDPDTLDWTWVAGSTARTTGQNPVDAQIGKNATTSPIQSYAVYDGGYIYWLEGWESNTYARNLMVVRRMSTTYPYGVETYTSGPSGTPSGFTGSTDSELKAWVESFNPSTGMWNMYNQDVAYPTAGYPAKLAVRNGYLYFGFMFDIRRMPLAGGPVETLFFGYHSPESQFRDHLMDYEDTPFGGYNNIPDHRRNGVPELEGVNFEEFDWVLFGNDLMFINGSGVEAYEMGKRWAKIDLVELERRYDEQGPVRVDRASPQWVTVSGASSIWEQISAWADQVNALDLYWKDGGRPLAYAPMKRATVPTSGPLAGRLVFAQVPYSADLTITDVNYGLPPDRQCSVVSVLEPGELMFEADVTVLFEGKALKGYSNVRALNAAEAPEEVRLS